MDGAVPARGFHSPHHWRSHIIVLEMLTVRLGLESFRRFLARRDTWMLLK